MRANDKIIRRVLAFFLLISMILVLVAVNAVRNINRSVATSDWVNHTHEVILETQGLLASLHAGDAALRTYLITGQARDDAAARDAYAEMLEHGEILRALTNSETGPRDEIAELVRVATTRAAFATDLSAQRALPGSVPATMLAADISAGTTTEIRRRVDRIKEQQMTLLADRDTASYLQAQTTRWTVWAGVALDVVLLAGVVWLIRDDLKARRRVVETLEMTNRDLDAKVRERTTELATANDQLSIENLERRWTNQALEHQVRYDQLIINSINDLVLVLTKVSNISRINPAVVQATGFEGAELINKPFSSLVEIQPDRTGVAPKLDQLVHALKTGRELRSPGLLRRKGGSRIPIRITLCPLRDGNNVVGGVVILEVAPPPAGNPA